MTKKKNNTEREDDDMEGRILKCVIVNVVYVAHSFMPSTPAHVHSVVKFTTSIVHLLGPPHITHAYVLLDLTLTSVIFRRLISYGTSLSIVYKCHMDASTVSRRVDAK